jgi:hypothetical protein
LRYIEVFFLLLGLSGAYLLSHIAESLTETAGLSGRQEALRRGK